MTSTSGRRVSHPDLPCVSVIITCYNQGRFLADAIETVRRQTFRDFEILVVDDGSTDDTPTVAARARGIRYVRQGNQGVGAARNSGFRATEGRYVMFLDADDRLLPEALEAGVASLEARPQCGFVSGHYRMITMDGRHLRLGPQSCVGREHYVELLRRNYIGMNATVLFRRQAIEGVGGFDCSLRACEDYDVYLRIARSWPVHCHDKIVAEYRRHDSNMSRDLPLMLRTSVETLRKQRRHLRGARERSAHRQGLGEYRRRYGDPLLKEVLEDLHHFERWKSAVRGIVCLLRYRPANTARWFVRTVGRRMARRRNRQPDVTDQI